jgi:hypothetical protein
MVTTGAARSAAYALRRRHRSAGGEVETAALTELKTVVLLALAAVVLSACGAGGSGAQEVTIAELVEDQEGYDGDLVVVEGVVHRYDDPLHYWLEDDAVNRVEVEPHGAVEERVGESVRVRGEYHFRPDQGRVITIAELEPIGDAPASAPSAPRGSEHGREPAWT